MESGQIQKLYDRLSEIETLLAQAKAELRELLESETETPAEQGSVAPEPIVSPVGMHGPCVRIPAESEQENPETVERTHEPCVPTGDESPSAYYTADEDDPEPDAVEILDDEDDEEQDPGVEGKHPDLSFITINERVRFRQNLFGGSKEQFDEAMALLQSLTSYADARRYLIDDLEWNPADDEIQAEFLEKLYLCFKEAR